MVTKPHQTTGLKRLLRALQWSLTGLKTGFTSEAAFRQEVLAAALLVPLGLWLGKGGVEKGLLTGSVLLVLIVELVNSSIEATVDRVGKEHHPLAGQAKDMGSAAVFLSLVSAAMTWALLLLF